jgi:flagellar hook-associated protein 1 FlgK
MSNGDIFGTAVSGLLAFQRGLAVTGHNIANVNTPGYSRQRVELVTRTPQFTGGGFVGTGVTSNTVSRVYDGFITTQFRAATSTTSQLEHYHQMAAQVDNLFADPQAGLSPTLQAYFSAVHDVASDPTSIPARQVMLAAANSLAARFHHLDGQLTDMRASVNTEITDTVNEINDLSQGIADINSEIVRYQGFAGGQVPNDLLDRRDELVRQLAEKVAVTTVPQDDGALNVFIGNGQTLVLGALATDLSVSRDAYDATRYEVAFTVGGTTTVISDALTGGTLGGALQFRNEILDGAQNTLGRVAMALSSSMNDQHQLGMDLTGALGGDFFYDIAASSVQVLDNSSNTGSGVVAAAVTDVSALTTSDYLLQRTGASYTLTRLSDNSVTTLTTFPGASEEVDGVTLTLSSGTIAVGDRILIRPTRQAAGDFAVALTDPSEIAAAAPIRTVTTLANTGNASISAGTVNSPPPTNANLTQTVTLTFTSSAQFDVNGTGTGNPSGVAYTSGGNITYNGWTIQINGTPQAGDVFTIQANTNGYSDNRNARLMADLQSTGVLNGSTTTYQDAYGALVADVGTKTHSAEVNYRAQESLLSHVTEARDAVSAVNLDEEAANMMRFQQAYQAAAQMISVSDNVFQTLLAAVRR